MRRRSPRPGHRSAGHSTGSAAAPGYLRSGDHSVLEPELVTGDRHHRGVVRREHEGDVSLGEIADASEHGLGGLRIELRRRFVGHDHRCAGGEGLSDRHALLLPPGELGRSMVEAVSDPERAGGGQQVVVVHVPPHAMPAAGARPPSDGPAGCPTGAGRRIRPSNVARPADSGSRRVRSRCHSPRSTLPWDGRARRRAEAARTSRSPTAPRRRRCPVAGAPPRRRGAPALRPVGVR